MIAIGTPSRTARVTARRRCREDPGAAAPGRGWTATSTSSSSDPVPPAWPRALAVRPLRGHLVTKDDLDARTRWAQGGLAAVLVPTDTLEHHVRDTLVAGAGLCDEPAVRELVAEAPRRSASFMRLGGGLDPDAEGRVPR